MERLISKSFILIIVINLITLMTHFMFLTSMSGFTELIGGTKAEAGIIAGAYTLAALAFRLLSGKLLDSHGRQWVLIMSLSLISVAAIAYPFLSVIPLLILARFTNGLGYSAYSTASGTIVADIVPKKRLSEGISILGIAGPVATALGPFLGLYLFKLNVNTFFMVAAVLSLLALVISFFVRYEKEKNSRFNPNENRRQGKFIEKTAFRFFLTMILIYLPLDAIMIFSANYGSDRNMSQMGLFFIVHASAMLLSKLVLGRIVDRKGPNSVFVLVMICGILGLIILAFAQTDLPMLIGSFIFGISMGLNTSILNTVLIRTSPADCIGASSATFFLFGDIGSIIGAIIMSIAIQLFGFTTFFLIAAGCFIFALLSYIILLWKKARL